MSNFAANNTVVLRRKLADEFELYLSNLSYYDLSLNTPSFHCSFR
jgi:hypothetical protein